MCALQTKVTPVPIHNRSLPLGSRLVGRYRKQPYTGDVVDVDGATRYL